MACNAQTERGVDETGSGDLYYVWGMIVFGYLGWKVFGYSDFFIQFCQAVFRFRYLIFTGKTAATFHFSLHFLVFGHTIPICLFSIGFGKRLIGEIMLSVSIQVDHEQ